MNFFSPKKKKPEQLSDQSRKLIEATCNGWTTAVAKIHENSSGSIDVNVRTETGTTALHIAAHSGDTAMVKLLIRLGADANCRDVNNQSTPLHLAAMRSKNASVQDLMKLKKTIGCDELTSSTMYQEVKYSLEMYEAVMVALVRKGADLNARDKYGKTALHLAVRYRSDCVKTLLGLGADVDAEDDEGRLPWHYALRYDNYEGLRWLLAFGADINHFDVYRKDDVDEVTRACGQSRLAYLMFDQLTRLRAAQLFVSTVYCAHKGTSSQRYREECEMEVRKMQLYEIDDGVSLYDLLHMNPSRRAAYAKSCLDRSEGMLIQFETEFPNYYGIIRACFRHDNKRKTMLNDAKLAWYQITRIGLPDICVEHILSNFNSCHLKILIDGAKHHC